MIVNIIMWLISIFFILIGFVGLFSQPLPFLFMLLFGLIVNPKIFNKLKSSYNIFGKKWIKPAAFVLCMVLFAATVEEVPVDESKAQNDNANPIAAQVNNEAQPSGEKPAPSDEAPPIEEGAKLSVHYIDVGQADSIFIELPNKQTMLIDAGNNEDGEAVVNYIKNLKYDTINYVVGTHPHEDHIGGLDTVINTFSIGNIYMPKAQANTATFEDVLMAIQNKGLKVNTAKAGTNILNVDNLNIDIVAPVNDTYEELNNYSAVIKMTYGNNSFLFMGDAEALAENEITANVKADIIKIGHHGSNTSTSREFLSKVQPTYAVISVGKDNSYGHPSDSVLALLDEFNVNVFRTDEQGTTIARSDGERILLNRESLPYKPNAPPATQQVQQQQPVVSNTPQIVESTPKVEEPVIEEPAIAEETPAVEEPKEITVYITKTGEKYHSDGCQYLKKSQIAISLDDAKSLGYTSCSKCNPPQ